MEEIQSVKQFDEQTELSELLNTPEEDIDSSEDDNIYPKTSQNEENYDQPPVQSEFVENVPHPTESHRPDPRFATRKFHTKIHKQILKFFYIKNYSPNVWRESISL